MAVASQSHLAAQRVQVKGFAASEKKSVCRKVLGRRHAVQGRGDGNDQYVAGAIDELVERGQSFGNEILMRRKSIVGQRFPIRQQPGSQLRCKKRYFLQQPLGGQSARRNNGNGL